MTAEEIIGLADAIEGLRAAIAEAMARGGGQPIQFRVEPVELTLQAVVTRDASGKIGWGALGVGASRTAATTQTLRLHLTPVLATPDGATTSDFTITSAADAAQRIGRHGD